MSEITILWIVGTVITLQTAIVGAIAAALWVHVGHCKEIAASMARVEVNQERITQDVGDHDHGMRRDIREHTGALFKLDARVETLERRRDEG